MTLSLEKVLQRTGGRWVNPEASSRKLGTASQIQVSRPAPLSGSQAGDLAYFFSKEYKGELPLAQPTILITGEPFVGPLEKSGLALWTDTAIVACPDPYLAMGVLSEDFARAASSVAHLDRPAETKIHPSAVIAADAKIGHQVKIGPYCVIESGAQIGDGSVLYAGCSVGPNVTVGQDCVLFPSVVLYENVQIGNRVRIHASSVVGADGFGYAARKSPAGMSGHQKIFHLGVVVIEDDVEIGAMTTIDRSTLGETRIGRFVKIDNQVQVGHNVVIGEGSILCAGVGLAGRASVGRYALLGGFVGVANAVHVGDGASVAAMTGVSSDVPPRGAVAGNPQREYSEHFRAHALLNRLLAERSSAQSGASGQEKK